MVDWAVGVAPEVAPDSDPGQPDRQRQQRRDPVEPQEEDCSDEQTDADPRRESTGAHESGGQEERAGHERQDAGRQEPRRQPAIPAE